MLIKTNDDYTNLSFGKLSDKDVVANSPFSSEQVKYRFFSTPNIQYLVDNIADMYGYRHGTIKATVQINDLEGSSTSLLNREAKISFNFSLNAQINTYDRTSTYGKHFMYQVASTYGNEIVFGIIAHEIGHLVAHNALNVMETKIVHGRPALTVVKTINNYYDELCADYLAGVTLSKARPAIPAEPLKSLLSQTVGGRTHPDGYWRKFAIEMGAQWGKNNTPALTDRILSDINQQKNLLDCFCRRYYSDVFLKTHVLERFNKTELPESYMENCNLVLGYL